MLNLTHKITLSYYHAAVICLNNENVFISCRVVFSLDSIAVENRSQHGTKTESVSIQSLRAAFSLIIQSFSAKRAEWEQQFALAKSSSVGTLAGIKVAWFNARRRWRKMPMDEINATQLAPSSATKLIHRGAAFFRHRHPTSRQFINPAVLISALVKLKSVYLGATG